VTDPRPWHCPQDDTCPAGSHDTYSAHRYGCRSGKAREGHRLYKKRLREGRNQPRLVDSTGIARRIEACHLMGWSGVQIGQQLGVTGWAINRLRRRIRPKVTTSGHARMAPVLERLALSNPPVSSQSTRIRNWARREKFVPLLAWDDIDDPHAHPSGVARPIGTRRRDAELHGRIVEHTRAGRTAEQIAEALGITERTVTRHRARHADLEDAA